MRRGFDAFGRTNSTVQRALNSSSKLPGRIESNLASRLSQLRGPHMTLPLDQLFSPIREQRTLGKGQLQGRAGAVC